MHLMTSGILLLLLAFPSALLSQSEEGCEVVVTAQNRERVITGIVHTECSLPHTPPWGNWGVISDYGLKIDGYQFPRWYLSDGLLQWNSCTDEYTEDHHFNPSGSSRQESTYRVASHGEYRRRYPNHNCPDTSDPDSYDPNESYELGCSNGALESRATNYMKLYELDSNDFDDLVTTLEFPATRVNLSNCNKAGCSPGASSVTMNFRLSPGQDVSGRVVDLRGNGVAGATVRAHYDTSGKPTPRVTFEPDSRTDANGEFLVRNVGIQVPFYIDVLAPGHAPTQSKRFTRVAGATKLEDIVLTKTEAVVVVTVRDKIGAAVRGATVTLFADPANYPQKARGSWLLPRGFRQSARTSPMGNARFSGVHPGRVLVKTETTEGTAGTIATVVGGAVFSLTLTVQ